MEFMFYFMCAVVLYKLGGLIYVYRLTRVNFGRMFSSIKTKEDLFVNCLAVIMCYEFWPIWFIFDYLPKSKREKV